jgi:predicted DCC family thiol-disulfide oxidoreductase YuxK
VVAEEHCTAKNAMAHQESTIQAEMATLVGYDTLSRPRSLLLYDGGCGVCKFLVQFVIRRDPTDAVRFAPLQSATATRICSLLHIPIDISTAILVQNHGDIVSTHSSSILRLLPYLGFPYSTLGPVLLWIPLIVRDTGYRLFARNRGDIWKMVKRITGMGDTMLTEYRPKIVGLDGETLPDSWGFGPVTDEGKKQS